jgi:hypothetical protein
MWQGAEVFMCGNHGAEVSGGSIIQSKLLCLLPAASYNGRLRSSHLLGGNMILFHAFGYVCVVLIREHRQLLLSTAFRPECGMAGLAQFILSCLPAVLQKSPVLHALVSRLPRYAARSVKLVVAFNHAAFTAECLHWQA